MGSNDAKRHSQGRGASFDARLATLAARQHGIVHLQQLLRLGLSSSGVRARVARGCLHRVHRSVYAVGHPTITREGEWLAAVFATGAGAVLSHRSAAALHAVRADSHLIEVSSPRPGGRRQSRFRIHRVAPLDPAEFGRLRGIPCTSLARTLIDIAPAVGRRGVERVIAEAQHRKAFDRGSLEAAVGRHPRRHGVGIVRSALATAGIERTLTRSELEERFLRLVRQANLPLPLVNHRVAVRDGGYRCDFVWPDARLIAETDGHAAHSRDRQFVEDRRRDAALKLAGWEVVRFAWLQVCESPGEVTSTVRRFREMRLAARG